MTDFYFPPRAKRQPLSLAPPSMRVLAWPLDTGTSVVTGGVSECAFKDTGIPSTSIDSPVTLTITSAAVSWAPQGGLQLPLTGTTAHAQYNPGAGADRDFMTAMLDLATFQPGETLLAWARLVTPAGWTANHAGSTCLISVGNLSAEVGAGGYAFELASNEFPMMQIVASGRSTGSPVGVGTQNGISIPENSEVGIVWELVCVQGTTFRFRVHISSNTASYAATGWSQDTDFADPTNGGVAPPGVTPTTGVRIARRFRSATFAQMMHGETISDVGLARFNEDQPASLAAKDLSATLASYRCGGIAALRRYVPFSGELPSPIPDGNADRTFGEITKQDMFVYLDGGIPIADQPKITLEGERPLLASPDNNTVFLPTTEGQLFTPTAPADAPERRYTANPWDFSSRLLPLHPRYRNNDDFEGTYRYVEENGLQRFGRVKTGSFANTILTSGHKYDQNFGASRGRSMYGWIGSNVSPPHGVTFWHAMRIYLDWDMPTTLGGVLLLFQLFPEPWTSGLGPMFTININTDNNSNRALATLIQYSLAEHPVVTSGIVKQTTKAAVNINTIGQQWIDLVAQVRTGPDVAKHQPFAKCWHNDTQFLNYTGPIGYNSPGGPGKGYALKTRIAAGLYPPSPTLIPNTERRVYTRRMFSCKDEGGYTLAQIRAALQAPL